MVGSFFCPGGFLLNVYRISPKTHLQFLYTPSHLEVAEYNNSLIMLVIKQFHWSSWWWMALTVLLFFFFFPRPRFILRCWGTNWHPSSRKEHLYAFLKFEITWQQKDMWNPWEQKIKPFDKFFLFSGKCTRKYFSTFAISCLAIRHTYCT